MGPNTSLSTLLTTRSESPSLAPGLDLHAAFVGRCLGLTTHLGPDAVLAFQPNWVRSPRHRNTSRLCDAACQLGGGAAKSSGKRTRSSQAASHKRLVLRSEGHTSGIQSPRRSVLRLLLAHKL